MEIQKPIRVKYISLEISEPVNLKGQEHWWFCDNKTCKYCKNYVDEAGNISRIEVLEQYARTLVQTHSDSGKGINDLTNITTCFPSPWPDDNGFMRWYVPAVIFYNCRLNKDLNYSFIDNYDNEIGSSCMLCVAYDISKNYKFNDDLDEIYVIHESLKELPKQKIFKMFLRHYKSMGFIESVTNDKK